MKIYVMRHFERHPDITYFIELTEEGKQNAIHKIPELESLNIDVIYSSPFIRTIQSIEPYANKYDIKINVENSLYEFMHSESFTLDNYRHTIDELNNFMNIVNTDYKSFLSMDNLEKPRIDKNSTNYETKIIKRIENFLNYLHDLYQHTNKNILLVTHKGTINAMLIHLQKNNEKIDIEDKYDMGKITLLGTIH